MVQRRRIRGGLRRKRKRGGGSRSVSEISTGGRTGEERVQPVKGSEVEEVMDLVVEEVWK